MLSCRDLELKTTDYLEGELPWRVRVTVRMHLLMCRHCRRYLAQLRLMIRALRLLGREADAGRGAEDDLVPRLLRLPWKS